MIRSWPIYQEKIIISCPSILSCLNPSNLSSVHQLIYLPFHLSLFPSTLFSLFHLSSLPCLLSSLPPSLPSFLPQSQLGKRTDSLSLNMSGNMKMTNSATTDIRAMTL